MRDIDIQLSCLYLGAITIVNKLQGFDGKFAHGEACIFLHLLNSLSGGLRGFNTINWCEEDIAWDTNSLFNCIISQCASLSIERWYCLPGLLLGDV